MGKLSQLEQGMIATAADGRVRAAPISAESASLVEQLYRSHARELCRYIAARFGLGPPEPEEVVQVAFSRLAATPEVSRMANPRGYLYTIACNVVADDRRRSVHRGVVHQQWGQDEGDEGVSELSPERVALAQERFVQLEQALRAMPVMRRRIFLLIRAEGLSVAEVAARFGIRENAVHKHVSRALQDCAVHLGRPNPTAGGRP